MRDTDKFIQVTSLFITALLVLACNGGLIAATKMPVPSVTPTARPTKTPLPTATSIPTPAPLGEAVLYKGAEITVLDVVKHDLIYPGGLSAWYPSDKSKIFIDMGVLVRNKVGSVISTQWKYVGVLEDTGEAWYPTFASKKTVPLGTEVDPFLLEIPANQTPGEFPIMFVDDTYLRLIFIVSKEPGKTILFGIENSPFITFQLK
jgi:hypothetical protein